MTDLDPFSISVFVGTCVLVALIVIAELYY